jgi:hypothetical protein
MERIHLIGSFVWLKWKLLTILAVCMVLLGAIPKSESNSINPFYIEFGQDQALAFQYDPQFFYIENIGALLNGTDATLRLTPDGGTLAFLNDATTTVLIWAENCSDGLDVSISGSPDFIQTGTLPDSELPGEWTATFPAATSISITWSWRLESYIDKYTMLGIGLFGVGLIFFACIWATLGFRKWGFDIESVSRLDIAFIVFLIGMGFILVWLWR